MKSLQTFNEVVAALGGTSAVADLVDRTAANVCQWRKRHEQFPAEFYLVIVDALDAEGLTVPHNVFRFVRPNLRRPRKPIRPRIRKRKLVPPGDPSPNDRSATA